MSKGSQLEKGPGKLDEKEVDERRWVQAGPDQTVDGRSVMVTVNWWSLCVLTSYVQYCVMYCVV